MRSTAPDIPLPSRILIVPKKNPTATADSDNAEGECMQQCDRNESYPESEGLDQAIPDSVSISDTAKDNVKQTHAIYHSLCWASEFDAVENLIPFCERRTKKSTC